jgi:transcriptional regulator with XRE-family HTH domain
MMKGGSSMLGKRLKLLRKLRELTQEEISQSLGIERTRYSKWEKGVSEPNLKMLCRIADYFHVSTDYLLGRTNILTPPSWKK